MDELSPGSRALYEILVSPTREEYEARLHDYLNAVKISVTSSHNSSSSAPETKRACTASLHASSSSAKDGLALEDRLIHDCLDGGSTATAPEAVDVNEQGAASISSPAHPTSAAAATASTRIPAAAPLDSTSDSVPSSSTATATTTSAGSHHVLGLTCQTTKDDYYPEAWRLYDLLVGRSGSQASATPELSSVLPLPSEIKDASDAVEIDAAGLVASAPTSCSAECPNQDASVYAAALIPSTTSNSSATICDVVPERAATAVNEKAPEVDATSETAPTTAICLPGSTSGENPMSMFLTLWSTPMPFNSLPVDPPSSTPARLSVLESFTWSPVTCSTILSGPNINTPPSLLADAYVFNEVSAAIVPWPPPS